LYIQLTYPWWLGYYDENSRINFCGGPIMPSVQTKLFKSNKSQAVRLPKAIAFPDSVTDVEIIAVGNKRIITPAAHSWDDWFDSPGVSDDFMTQRLQPEDQIRENL
jgi:antitoxin VapB